MLNIDVIELINLSNQGLVIMANDNKADNSSMILSSYYQGSNGDKDVEKLSLIITHQQEMMKQKDMEIEALKQIIELLKR